MKKTTLLIASCGLASGLALAAQEQETGAYEPDPEMTTRDPSDYATAAPADPAEEMGQAGEATDPTTLSAADLEGKAVMTATGEEIGEIEGVWSGTAGDERIATVGVGGFLGIGEKTIAIPLSDLQAATTGDGYETSMTRDSIEAHPEFDESGYTREGGDMQDEDPMEAMGEEEDPDY